MIRRMIWSAVASGVILGAAGCRHKCCSSGDTLPPRPFLPAGPGPAGNIPPAGVPITPPGGTYLPPVGPGGGSLPPPDLTPAAPAPARSSPELLLPDPIPGGASSRSQYPVPGQRDPILGGPLKPAGGATLEPPVAAPGTTAPKTIAPASTAGLPGFTKVKAGVASGRKPALDGFDALKTMGYRAVAYLHPAGADVSAAREVAEKRGLTFVAIETTPETLSAALTEFNAVVTGKPAGPVYVYDDTGARAGALWYLHFRTVEQESGEVAKIRARSLGLTDDGDEAKAFWVAIQQHLATR